MKHTVLLLLSVLIVSCSQQEKVVIGNDQSIADPYSQKMTLVDSIEIPVDDYTNYRSNFLDVHTDSLGQEYLLIQNDLKRSIRIYNLEDKSEQSVIPLYTQEPNLIKDPRGLIYFNEDSIYVIDSEKYALKLINSKGEIRDSYNLLSGRLGYNSAQPIGFTSLKAVPIGNKISIFGFPDRTLFSSDYWVNGQINIILDLATRQTELIHGFPDTYHGGVWGLLGTMNSRALFDSNKFIYSFGADPNVYVANALDTINAYQKHYAGSDYITEVASWQGEYDDIKGLNDHLIQSSFYFQILYDKYRNVFYRITSIGGENVRTFDDKSISIIILNAAFEKIGETRLPDNTYYFRDTFIAKSGLYISTKNINNDINENTLSYHIFRVENH